MKIRHRWERTVMGDWTCPVCDGWAVGSIEPPPLEHTPGCVERLLHPHTFMGECVRCEQPFPLRDEEHATDEYGNLICPGCIKGTPKEIEVRCVPCAFCGDDVPEDQTISGPQSWICHVCVRKCMGLVEQKEAGPDLEGQAVLALRRFIADPTREAWKEASVIARRAVVEGKVHGVAMRRAMADAHPHIVKLKEEGSS